MTRRIEGSEERARYLPLDASDADVLRLLDAYVGLLAASRWDDAARFLRSRHPTDAALLEWCVCTHGGYREDEPGNRVDDPAAVFRSLDAASCRRVRAHGATLAERGGYVEYDLPMGGTRSDLTLEVAIDRVGDRLELVFEGIHVM